MKKSLMGIMATTMILLSFLGSALLSQVLAADPASWYKVKNGVLTSDLYSLYPYATESVDMGMSKFGEMIGETGSLAVGLQYPGYESVATYDQRLGTSRDPFANEGVERKLWLNGWVMEIRYTHRTLRDRKILSMAMYADMAAYGGNWITGFPYNDLSRSPHGGRKTTGYATSEDLQVLYDGPRSYIALCITHIYDWNDDNLDGVVQHPDETWAVVDLKITFIFDKVKKQVIILKDIKLLMSGKELASPVDIQFGDREEWDLGPAPEWPSYAHFYHQQLKTCYGPEWHMATAILREYDYREVGRLAKIAGWGVPVWDARDPYGPPIANGSVRVYVNGIFKEEGLDYHIDYTTGVVEWHIAIADLDEVRVIYKLHKGEWINREFIPFAGVPHLYDVAQIIAADLTVVGWKAFWPVLSDYTVDGWTMSLTPLINVSQPDFLALEPDIPFVIGEWDFMLGKQYPLQFRGVEVVGLTDYYQADDEQMGVGHSNIIEREAMYQLNEVFNPWDLVSAVHKPAARWVEFTDYIEIDDTYTTDSTRVPVIVRPYSYFNLVQIGPKEWIPDPTDWDQYGVFSERIVNLDTGKLLLRGWDYDIELLSNGRAKITFNDEGYMKILYSTMGMYVTSTDNENNALAGLPDYDLDVLLGDQAIIHPIEFNIFTPEFDVAQSDLAPYCAKLKVRAFNVNRQPTTPENDAVYLNGRFCGLLTGTGDLTFTPETLWTISEFNIPPNYLATSGEQLVQIFVNCKAQTFSDVITPSNPATWPTTGAAAYIVEVDWGKLEFAYDEYSPMPSYEWITVGRDAHSVDSIGSAMVAAIFKDKQVEIGLGGMDMKGATYDRNIPYLLYKFGTGNTFSNYFITPDASTPGQRLTLMDDWCTYWPIASSNIISVGGPLSNWITMYFNDFTNAFYGAPWFTPYAPWSARLAGPACWNKTAYINSGGETGLGYATITTYLDINGTVGFMVYGLDARDTYYASYWLHGDRARGIPAGIHQLQEAPKCLTSIILEIDYDDAKHPTFSIVECLGTISETEWIHGLETKGGIHDP